MANNTWIGNALDRKQVSTITPANVEVGDIFTATINGKAISVTATAATVANVTGLMTTAWNASTIPEFAEITASDSTTHITLTADVAGVPFTVTSAATNGGAADTQTFVTATTTANSSKNDWNNTANWSAGTVPADTEDVYFDGAVSNVSALYNLEQSSIQPATLNIINDYSGAIGAPYTNTTVASTPYYEYRSTELAIGPVILNMRCNSGRIKINAGTDPVTLNVYKTGQSSETGLPSFQFRGTNAGNVANITGGTVGIATLGTHTATIATLRMTGGTVTCGAGTTLTTIDKAAGTLTIESAVTTITNDAGELTINGSGAVTTINANGGSVNYNSSGTITTLTASKLATVTFDGRNVARTVTNTTRNDTAKIVDTNTTVTWSNPISYTNADIPGLTVGRTVNITPV